MALIDPFLERRVASTPASDPQTRAEALTIAARALRAAEYVCVLTGAGTSAESGIPTFRDALTGHWAQYSPQELATQLHADIQKWAIVVRQSGASAD